MSKELEKQQNDLSLVDVKTLEAYVKFLNLTPKKDRVTVNNMADGAKYLPITFVELQLDELFFGLWQTKNFRWQVVANEVIGSLELGVFHPVAKEWIWREGSAATIIQQRSKQRGGSGILSNVDDKIPNALEKGFPKLKAECVKNAAKSLGKVFGRDLNRLFSDDYQPFSDKVEQASHDDVKAMIDACRNVHALDNLARENRDWWENEIILSMLTNRRAELAVQEGGLKTAKK